MRKVAECLAKFGVAMVSLQDVVSVSEAIAYRVILCGQDPQICSQSVRAESHWTSAAGMPRKI